jgi:hypothetical protein
VLFVNRNAAFGVGALLGAAGAFVWDRRSRLRTAAAGPAPEERQRELREKLAAAEPPKPPEPPPPTPPPPRPEVGPSPPPAPPGPPPADEFEAMRRRIHEEGKAAAEEMRKAPDEAS